MQEINQKIKYIENSLVFLEGFDVESLDEKINKIETDVENCKEKIGLIESKNVKSEGDYYSEESSQSYSSEAEALSKLDTNILNIPDERPLTIEC